MPATVSGTAVANGAPLVAPDGRCRRETGDPRFVRVVGSRREFVLSRTAVGLEPLLALDGVENVSLADDEGRVLSARGDAGAAGLVLRWGRDVRAVSRARARDLEDLMITSTSAYHLLRRLAVDDADPAWVYVRVGRAEGNLALTRRRLAMLVLRAPAPAVPAVPADPSVPAAPSVPLPRRRPGALLPPAVRRADASAVAVAARVPAPLFEPTTPSPEPAVLVAAAPPPSPRLPALPPAPVPAPVPAPAPVSPTPAAEWATDLSVMRRLLAGLRRFV